MRRLPPLRVCRDCGRRFRSWNENAAHGLACPARRDVERVDGLEVGGVAWEVRQRRLQRRAAAEDAQARKGTGS